MFLSFTLSFITWFSAGFRTTELKVQVTSTGKLRIAGERKPNTGQWLRFQREFELPADADTEKISAKFEDGVLYIRQPKRFIPPNLQGQAKPKEEAKPPATEIPETGEKPAAGGQPVRENDSKNSQDKPKAQANGKRTNAPKPQERAKPKEEIKPPTTQPPKTTGKSSSGAQPVPEVAPKNKAGKQTDNEPKPEEKPKNSSEEETPQKEKEQSGLKKEEEKKRDGKDEKEKGKGKKEGHGRSDDEHEDGGSDGVAADQRTGNKATAKLHNGGGGIIRQGEGYKQVVDAMIKELRSKGVSLVLSVLIFVIFYLSVTKKANVVEGEL